MSSPSPSIGYVSQQIMHAAVYYQKCDLDHKQYSQFEKLNKYVIVFADWVCSKVSPDYRTIKSQTLTSRNITRIDSTTTTQPPVTDTSRSLSGRVTPLNTSPLISLPQESDEPGRAGSKLSGLNEQDNIMSNGADQAGADQAAAGQIPDAFTKVAAAIPSSIQSAAPTGTVASPQQIGIPITPTPSEDHPLTDATESAALTKTNNRQSIADTATSLKPAKKKGMSSISKVGAVAFALFSFIAIIFRGGFTPNQPTSNSTIPPIVPSPSSNVTNPHHQDIADIASCIIQGGTNILDVSNTTHNTTILDTTILAQQTLLSKKASHVDSHFPNIEIPNIEINEKDPIAQNSLGLNYLNGQGVTKNDAEAVRWFRLAANQGNAIAQINLGWCYLKGQGVERNDTEAVRLYTLAADQGDAIAQINLGWCYLKGQGVERNDTEAVRLYTLAADQGHARAQRNLGWCYESGRGVEQNDEEAVRLYTLAADQGDAVAQRNLGWCYESGRGVEQNDEEAVRLYTLAADQGDAVAQRNLGWCYESGRGVEQNDEEAVRLYTLAADQGDALAQTNIGWCYLKGQGVTQNDAEAVRWFRLAANQREAAAQYNLGFCYEKGRGVTRSYIEASKCYQLAADQGNVDAKRGLERLERLKLAGGN